MKTHVLDATLSWSAWKNLAEGPHPVVFSEEVWERVEQSYSFVQKLAQSPDRAYYGINTGFGALYNVSIGPSDLAQLQLNLIRSHACGTGQPVEAPLVRLMLLTKALSLSYGHSGVARTTVERLLALYEADCLPVVYERGSLGASGDLAPLSHLCLPLVGEGEVVYRGKRMPAADAMTALGFKPLVLGPKEGLALINGTQFMLAHAVWLVVQGYTLGYWADVCAALSLDAFDGRIEPFDPRVHLARPQPGQAVVAERVREWLAGSPGPTRPKTHVQDPYSFRCVPQVHGASWDALGHLARTVSYELHSATDNPMVFADDEEVISAGNFHGQPLALAMDFAAMALAEYGSISERRLYQMVNGKRGLPAFLTPNPGLHSGLMIVQYAAAAVVSLNKQLCTPASVDSIESSASQEDHVSMGANAAVQAVQVLNNVWDVLGMEWLAACQALELRGTPTSELLQNLLDAFRTAVPFLNEDRIQAPDMADATAFLKRIPVDDERCFPALQQ
jgi:histidine ammonia-lyase